MLLDFVLVHLLSQVAWLPAKGIVREASWSSSCTTTLVGELYVLQCTTTLAGELFFQNNSPASVVVQEDDLRASLTMPIAGSHENCESK